MKQFFKIAILLCGCAHTNQLSAQPSSRKHELFLGYGAMSYNMEKQDNLAWDPYTRDYTNIKLEQPKSTGVFFVGYQYSISKLIGVGATVCYENIHGNTTSIANVTGKWKHAHITVMPSISVRYLSRRSLQLYAMANGGATFSKEVLDMEKNGTFLNKIENNKTVFAWQVTPIGIRFGNKVGVFVEGGYGFKGIVAGGLSAQF